MTNPRITLHTIIKIFVANTRIMIPKPWEAWTILTTPSKFVSIYEFDLKTK